jgi:hypothetical protein
VPTIPRDMERAKRIGDGTSSGYCVPSGSLVVVVALTGVSFTGISTDVSWFSLFGSVE